MNRLHVRGNQWSESNRDLNLGHGREVPIPNVVVSDLASNGYYGVDGGILLPSSDMISTTYRTSFPPPEGV